VSKNDFVDWKRHPVTQQVFSQLQGMITQLSEELVEQTVEGNQLRMVEKASAIKAYRDLLNIEFEEPQ